jgi:predicted amidohydrolase
MSKNLITALIQANLVWEDPRLNRDHFANKIKSINQAVDLIILPEMFTTGFTMNASKNAETMEGSTVEWMQNIAAKRNSAITGSVVIEENKKYFNRLLFVLPDGKVFHYDKRHTFTFAGEDKIYKAGREKIIIYYNGWKICPLICYDLRFPVWSRNIEDYDLLIYVANWPKPRIKAWDALLKARAIENMCYCVGVNRIGKDESNHEYSGNSAVYDVLGEEISNIRPNKEQTEVVILCKEHITTNREKLHFLNDRDAFTLK